MRLLSSRPLAVALLVLLCAGPAHADCRRVDLVDAETQRPIVGPEDLAVERAGQRLYVSAFDRWALEDALAANAARLPRGGIYAIGLAQLRKRPATLPARRVTEGDGGDFHPHGIALQLGGDATRLYAINHVHERTGDGWRRRTRIETYRVRADGGLEHLGGVADERLCRANDLVATRGGELLITRDHGACGRAGRVVEDVLGLRRAGVLAARLPAPGSDPARAARISIAADGLGLANGIALAPDGERVAVAATRERRIHVYRTARLLEGEAAAAEAEIRIELDGGPDNLSWSETGLLAAAHPSLLRTGMARHRWLGARRSGTRLLRVDPDAGRVETLVEDAEGGRLNAGTVAVAFGTTLVAGSVLDSALLVCTLPGGGDGN